MPRVDPSQLPARMAASPAIARATEALAPVPGCWLVGGAVRDLLLGGQPLDLDVVVEGDAVAVAADAAARLDGRMRGHDRFGTATVEAGGLRFDLATARRESYAAPGALPAVEPAPLDEDLRRRDFTVNALAAGLSRGRTGELRAVDGALGDLEAGRLRVLHDRSFLDDPTRLLRLVRYGARLGFAEEAATRRLAREAIAGGAMSTVSGPRVGAELRLLLREPGALEAMRRARALGLGRALHPGLAGDEGLAARALARAPAGTRPDLVLLAASVTGLERSDLRAWLDRLGLSSSERDAVVGAALDAPALAEALSAARRPSQIARVAAQRAPGELAMAAALGADGPVAEWDRHLRHVGLEIDGGDLIAAGVPEGPVIGRALAEVLSRKLDGELGGRQAELDAALEATDAI